MDRIPLGVPRFDELIGGGAPVGSSVLLATEIGAGGRDFAYTGAVLNGLARAAPDQFAQEHGELPADISPPASIRYLSFTNAEETLLKEIRFMLDDDIVETATEAIDFKDFSPEYFRMSPVPADWYLDQAQSLSSLGEQQRTGDVFDAVGSYLDTIPEESLVIVDSITDLLSVADKEMDWTDVTLLMKGLDRVFERRRGLLLLLTNLEALTPTRLGSLMQTTDATLMFEWESGGTERDRTMFVRQFRGVFSQLEQEDIIRFETEITDRGFDISDVRKIR